MEIKQPVDHCVLKSCTDVREFADKCHLSRKRSNTVAGLSFVLFFFFFLSSTNFTLKPVPTSYLSSEWFLQIFIFTQFVIIYKSLCKRFPVIIYFTIYTTGQMLSFYFVLSGMSLDISNCLKFTNISVPPNPLHVKVQELSSLYSNSLSFFF